ncbi:hypothetical protein [Aeoliella sp. SH292]|uniref:hypothetical protein n=1 Tax=Aeoliella sp. SH292 TaxID=3454464 RepID=UPI003F994B5B
MRICQSKCALLIWLQVFCVGGPFAGAAVTTSGQVNPNPLTTTASDNLYVGYLSSGEMVIDGGSVVQSLQGVLALASNVNGNATVEGAGSAWITSAVLRVGDAGTGQLDIVEGGAVSSATEGRVGNQTGSMGIVSINGEGSQWTMNGSLYVGSSGQASISIDSGGVLSNTSAIIGNGGDSVGRLDIHGVGSQWTNSGTLHVGNSGEGDLIISHGGAVLDTVAYVGYGTGSKGAVVVEGDGSSWTNSGGLYVGVSGNGSLEIRSGAAVTSFNGIIAQVAGSSGVVSIDGLGTTWTTGHMRIGDRGDGTLNVTGGATVTSQYVSIANTYPSSGRATVEGIGSRWTLTGSLDIGSLRQGILAIGDGATVEVGLDATLGDGLSSYLELSGGTLFARNVVADRTQLRGVGTIHTNGWILDGDWTFQEAADLPVLTTQSDPGGKELTVHLDWTDEGIFGVDRGAIVLEGGYQKSSPLGLVGNSANSVGQMTVTGERTKWSITGDVTVGNRGTGTLHITDGGFVSNTFGILGAKAGSAGHAMVHGIGSIWQTRETLNVGLEGQGSLTITGGALVMNQRSASIGQSHQGSGHVHVDGADSMWSVGSDLHVGGAGVGSLSITNGGRVMNAAGYISYGLGGGDAIVDGPNSTWVNSGRLTVADGSSASLHITNSGKVTSSGGMLGDAYGHIGKVVVDGHGSTWQNGGWFEFGASGSADMHVVNGGTITSSKGILRKSIVSIDGNGSSWQNTGTLELEDQNALLRVVAGATVSNGATSVSSGGRVEVVGPGSTWTNNGNLNVGQSRRGSLSVASGGKVTSSNGVIADLSGSVATAALTGDDSSWVARLLLTVGRTGKATLQVTGRATMDSMDGIIATNAQAVGTVLVDGVGSKWTVRDELTVGSAGQGSLTISGGGLVSVARALVIDSNLNGDSFIDMATGAMLAVKGNGDDTLDQFLTLVGGTDAIRYWDVTTSDWASLATATFGVEYTLEYITAGELLGYTLLTVGQQVSLPGDYNSDGLVDLADYTVWRDHLGSAAPHINDTTPWSVDSLDYQVWSANFGASTAISSSTPHSVPEPSSLLSLVCIIGTTLGASGQFSRLLSGFALRRRDSQRA